MLGKLGLAVMRASGLATKLLPLQNDAAYALAQWMKDVRGQPSESPDVELTNDSRSRLRYRGEALTMFVPWGATVSRVFSLYWRILPALKRRELHAILKAGGMLRSMSEDQTFDNLKKLSAIFFKFQDMLSVNWRDYCHLHLLRDYKLSVDMLEMKDEVVDWTQSKPVHKLFGSKSLFLVSFRQGVRNFLESAPKRMENYVPLTNEQFVSDPMHWATSGSSDAKKLEVVINGKVYKAQHTKWASALSMSKDELLRQLTRPSLQSNHVIQKRELGKVRPVVASDFSTNLKMSRVAHWLESMLAGHKNSTLFMTAKQQFKLWQDMVNDADDQMLIKMPVDQGHFDHSAGSDMIQIMNQELLFFISRYCWTSDRVEILSTMREVAYAVSGGGTWLGDLWIEYLSGICSGWRFTALYDTLANAGELHAVRSEVRKRSGYDPVVPDKWVCQGDDIRLITISYPAAVAIWSLYTEAGFDVNPMKFFISNKVDEFLRQVTRDGWIAGYPARMASLVFRNPVSRELLRGEDRVREMLTTWNQVFNRFGYIAQDAPLPLMISDIARSNHYSFDLVSKFLRTPACMGGAGMYLEYGVIQDWVSFEKGVASSNWKLAKEVPLSQTLSHITNP